MAQRPATAPRVVPPDREIDSMIGVFELLASGGKLKILYALAVAERSAGALGKAVAGEAAGITKQTAVLRAARMVESERLGHLVRYRLTDLGRAALLGAEGIRACLKGNLKGGA